MGASPKHRLSPEALSILGAINGAKPDIRIADGHDIEVVLLSVYHETLAGIVATAKRDKEERIQKIIRHMPHKMFRFVPTVGRGPGAARKPFARWVPDFTLSVTYKNPKLKMPDELRQRDLDYQRACLLMEIYEKGPERLKACAWSGCTRFIWDRTTLNRTKYCPGLHDRDRLRLRERKSRRKRSARR